MGAEVLLRVTKSLGLSTAVAVAVKRLLGLSMLFAGAFALSACATGSNAIDDFQTSSAISMAEATPSISVDPFSPRKGQSPAGTDRLIDEDTIRLAVTTADLSKLTNGQLPWASAATGSSGVITEIIEREKEGQICRVFLASRSAYNGLQMYDGEVCLDRRTGWWTRSMTPLGA